MTGSDLRCLQIHNLLLAHTRYLQLCRHNFLYEQQRQYKTISIEYHYRDIWIYYVEV